MLSPMPHELVSSIFEAPWPVRVLKLGRLGVARQLGATHRIQTAMFWITRHDLLPHRYRRERDRSLSHRRLRPEPLPVMGNYVARLGWFRESKLINLPHQTDHRCGY